MQIDGSVVIWAFGLVFVAFTGLVGVIWAMLNKRLSSIEDQAKIDRENMQKVVNQIYAEIKQSKDKTTEADQRILEEIGVVRQCISDLAVASGERRAGCIEKFATKEELNRGLGSIAAKLGREA